MNEILIDENIDNIKIEDMIYEIRGIQVMLDSDLANLYNTKTKRINEAVVRNSKKFPERYCFRITEDEYNSLKSQIASSKGGSRKGHSVFTEQGVAMLSSVLHTETAIKMSIKIIDAFVAMRHLISNNLIEQKYINNLVLEDHDKIKLLENSFQKFEEKRKVNEIYFNGQIFDAYFKIQEIFKEAKNKLIIIDGYADSTILNIIKRLDIDVIIITKNHNLLTKQDIRKYNLQYNNLKVIYNDTFHDRYFILDDSIFYHCGTSINKIGNKTFSINLISDKSVSNALLASVNNIIFKKHKKNVK